ncbi:MAG: hypothetical protein FWC44_01935 [Methanomassiliicoccaceae archaeon]|nr:hypothetical protein [Methanomassiliicoccaceae archaeon]MCL2317805.1 hypothetical protein [Methanomassiliicoccaceae archaeon]
MSVTEEEDLRKGSIELLKIMMVIGAGIGIVSVFLQWFHFQYVILNFDYSGYNFFAKSFGAPESGYFLYMPLVVLISSSAALVLSILSFRKYEKIAAAAGIILGLLIFAAVLLYVLYPETTMLIIDNVSGAGRIGPIKLGENLGPGVYSALVAGTFIFVGGLAILLNRHYESSHKKDE